MRSLSLRILSPKSTGRFFSGPKPKCLSLENKQIHRYEFCSPKAENLMEMYPDILTFSKTDMNSESCLYLIAFFFFTNKNFPSLGITSHSNTNLHPLFSLPIYTRVWIQVYSLWLTIMQENIFSLASILPGPGASRTCHRSYDLSMLHNYKKHHTCV